MSHQHRSLIPLVLIFTFLLTWPLTTSRAIAQEDEIGRLRQKVTELEQQIIVLEAHLAEAREHQVLGLNAWENRKNWRRLEVGMEKKEVLEILGQPIRVIGGGHTLWYYPNTYCGYCSFDNEGKLEAWAEP
jgi:hypothetical protein